MSSRPSLQNASRVSCALVSIILVVAIVAIASQAHAEPATARFIYLRGKGTESCPSEVDVRQAVLVRLGYDPFSSYASSTMFAEVSADASGKGGFTAALKLVDADNAVRGDRVLKTQGQCTDLMEAMALTISIAIDPMSVTRNGPPPGVPPSERSVASLPPIDPTSTSPPEQSPSDDDKRQTEAPTPPLRLTASLGPILSLGTAPAMSVGGVLSVDAQRGLLFGGIEGRADAPASAAANRALGRVESSLIAGALFAGLREGIFFACAVASLGSLSATSANVAESRDVSALIVHAGARAGIAIPLLSDRLELRSRVQGLANLTRHTLEISGQPAYRYPVASGDVSAAIALRFF